MFYLFIYLLFLSSLCRISYPLIQIATQSGKSVYLTVMKESNDSVVQLFKLISNRAASGLYRAITETHAFYRYCGFDTSHQKSAT